MIPNPIRKVLSSIQTNGVRALLMGGQACVFYGAAEFSRDTDFAILAEAANLKRLKKALADLEAEVIAVPPFELKYLRRGHAIHFRCKHPQADRMRVDVMSKMRGVDSFTKLWGRRTTVRLEDGVRCDLMSLPDLVQAKKTQRDKDWPMIRKLVEAHYFANRGSPKRAQVDFWLSELRTPQLLIEVARAHEARARSIAGKRSLLKEAAGGNLNEIERLLEEEESLCRREDEAYWQPLRRELEKMRHDLLKQD